MKKLTMICMITLVVLAAGQAFALPGVYRAGAPTMDLYVGECETRTISFDATGMGTSPLVSGGFLMTNSNESSVDIADCKCYDGELSPSIWDSNSLIIFDPSGYSGGLFVSVHNLGAGVAPSANILLCDVTFCGVYLGMTIVTIDTISGFDTWVNQDFHIYDFTIDAAVITAHVIDQGPCECFIAGSDGVQANVSGNPVTATYTASPSVACDNPPVYVYSENCIHGSIDPNTGVFTVPAFTTPPSENCTITVTDTANTDINTGGPITCTKDITILAGTECEGNFNDDQDVDGSDAATFKADFGRNGLNRPCQAADPCNGDFNCDGDADGSDAAIFKADFGRSNFNNPCPSLSRDPWCSY